ncbi:hypothetical protein ACA135_03875 [Methanobrevibacter acididurans]|uniref:hypothetical protein n=1 Tax=Methanobrevibacter acididurans TaxID=120963 RepID=UPI0038FD1B14
MRDLKEINKEIKIARKTLLKTDDDKKYQEAQSNLQTLIDEKRTFMNKDSGDFEMTENCWHKTHLE